MSDEINDGGPVYPQKDRVKFIDGNMWMRPFTGMSMRDYFAGLALGGLASEMKFNVFRQADFAESVARMTYDLADAMIAERDKRKDTK